MKTLGVYIDRECTAKKMENLEALIYTIQLYSEDISRFLNRNESISEVDELCRSFFDNPNSEELVVDEHGYSDIEYLKTLASESNVLLVIVSRKNFNSIIGVLSELDLRSLELRVLKLRDELFSMNRKPQRKRGNKGIPENTTELFILNTIDLAGEKLLDGLNKARKSLPRHSKNL